MALDADVWVERLDARRRRRDFALPDRRGRMDDLALQVRSIDDIVIDETERAHACRGEIERRRRPKSAGAQQQHLRVEQLLLTLGPTSGSSR